MTSILFVCLGNICRSPMAEAIFRESVKREGLESKVRIDSAGIREWHIGKPPHEGTRQVLANRGISVDGIVGRQVTREDLEKFDCIIVMDKKNLSSIEQLAGKELPHVHLLTDFIVDSTVSEVPDPYHTGEFEKTYEIIEAGCKGLLEVIRLHQMES
jgi:protein-tyrosine phosphatase